MLFDPEMESSCENYSQDNMFTYLTHMYLCLWEPIPWKIQPVDHPQLRNTNILVLWIISICENIILITQFGDNLMHNSISLVAKLINFYDMFLIYIIN